jgi:hypothetical protein
MMMGLLRGDACTLGTCGRLDQRATGGAPPAPSLAA